LTEALAASDGNWGFYALSFGGDIETIGPYEAS
jgi:hypothetical protein